ncbi:MAG: DUF4062 domain-containing protein [Bacteroidales bacterium]|nr:DUF4062 domain-containing protein [Bacteroidales bacterium]
MFNVKPIIFVSSTVSDLSNEREAARLAIEQINCKPSMCENTFIAQNRNSIDVCLNEVIKADVYILLLGGKYGYELDDGVSITEKEWFIADREGKPILVFNLKKIKTEQKQNDFANKVGNIYDGKFWKEVNSAFQLKDEIQKSLLTLFEEEKIKRKQNTEKLYSSLINIDFAQKIFIGALNIDRKEIIKNSINSERKLFKKSTNREVIYEALKQQNLKFSSDWVCFNNKIVSFHDISNSSIPLHNIVDTGTIEEFSTSEFYSIDDDYKNVFKTLLKFCLIQKLYKMGVEWVKNYNHFRFMPPDENLSKRVAKWHSKKDATRTVFEQTSREWKEKTYYTCKHFAFKIAFIDIENKWYISIVPDWAFTFDGKKPLYNEKDKITYLKRNERNQHVFNHVKFISHFLQYKDEDNLFSNKYKFIDFGDIVNFDSFPILNDDSWSMNEKEDVNNVLSDKIQVTLKF